MSDGSNIYQFPGDGKVTPEMVLESLGKVADQVELITCVVKFKEDSEYKGATTLAFNGMDDKDMLWLRYCFQEKFKPVIQHV